MYSTMDVVVLLVVILLFYLNKRRRQIVFFSRVRTEAPFYAPVRGGVGYLLYATECKTIMPTNIITLKTNLRMTIPKGVYGKIYGNVDLYCLYGFRAFEGVIDSDYEGEIIIVTTTTKAATINIGDVIAEIVFDHHIEPNLTLETPSSRRTGGFGSTGW